MIEKSAEITEIAKALLAFQSQATGVVKDSKNPHFKNRYASLEAVVDEARPVLQKVGISWMQAPGKISGGNIGMTTLLMHAASGQWISSDMEIPLGKQDPQGAGSALTYAQRYALMASLGLPPVDDDAESATDRNSSSAPQQGRSAAPASFSSASSRPAGAATLLDVASFLGEMKANTSSRDLINWSTSREIMDRYNKLDRKDRDTIDAAYNKFLTDLDRQEAA